MSNHEHGQPAEILLVEDNPGDVRLAREAFEKASIAHELTEVPDGRVALDYLHQRGEYAESPRPDLILLDLNLPKVDGIEVLDDIKGDSELRHIPVVVLTGSKAEEDVIESYKNHTNAYLTKPIDPDEFVELIRSIEEFWLTLVRLPPKPNEI